MASDRQAEMLVQNDVRPQEQIEWLQQKMETQRSKLEEALRRIDALEVDNSVRNI